LRSWGVELSDLGEWTYEGASWSYLNYPAKTGEVQVLDEFKLRVEATVAARGRLFPDSENRRLAEQDKGQVWAEVGRPPDSLS
jgi:hypothetical protein